MKPGDSINVGERLGQCELVSIESWHTIVVEKAGQFYRVSGLAGGGFTMTEEQIERSVERKFDSIDRRLIDGKLTQEEYDAEAERIRRWADAQRDKL